MKKYLLVNHSIDFGNISFENILKNMFIDDFEFLTFNKLEKKRYINQKSNIYKFLLSFKLRNELKKSYHEKIIFNSIGPATWAYGSYDLSKSILWIDWIKSLQGFFLENKFKKDLTFLVQKKIISKIPLIFCRTDIIKDHLINSYNVEPQKIKRLNAPFIFEDFEQKPREIKYKPKVLFIGNDFYRKGGDILLKNLDKLKNHCELTLVSDVKGLNDLDINIINHVEYLSKTHLKLLYENDIFILPSKFDPYGMVVPEAMSSSLAVVTTKNVLCFSNYIRNNFNGLICEKSTDCIDALIELLKDQSKIQKLKLNAYETMKKNHNSSLIKKNIFNALNL